MSELSPEARRVLMAARADAEPTAGDRARVHAMVVAAIAIPVASAAAASSVGAKLGTGATYGLVAKLSAAALATSLTVVGGYGAYTWTSRTAVAAKLANRVAVAAPHAAPKTLQPSPNAAPTPAVTTEAQALDAKVPSVSEAPRKQRASSVGSERASTPDRTAQVAKEIVWISSAESALDQRAPALALQALQQHATLFPQGELRQERLGLRAIALCALNRSASTTQVARTYLAQYPSSVLADRVRDACRASPARGDK